MSLSNRKLAPESGKSARKSSRLAAIPSDRRVPQTRSVEVGRNWYFSWDDFPLDEFLFVSLTIFDGIEESSVIPRLSASLHLLRLRWLSRALALSPGGPRLSPWSHPMNGIERKRSPKGEWNQTRESKHQPEALGSRRWSWTKLEVRGTERRHSQIWKP